MTSLNEAKPVRPLFMFISPEIFLWYSITPRSFESLWQRRFCVVYPVVFLSFGKSCRFPVVPASKMRRFSVYQEKEQKKSALT